LDAGVGDPPRRLEADSIRQRSVSRRRPVRRRRRPRRFPAEFCHRARAQSVAPHRSHRRCERGLV